jgi:ribosomal-protein-alanine N-acetyltransferase
LLEAALNGGKHDWFLEVRESNTAAVALYGAAGFLPSSRREKYYRNPPEAALVMRLVSCYRHGALTGEHPVDE